MSKPHKPQQIKQPLVTRTQRKRTSRHNAPHVMRKRSVREIDGKVVVVHALVEVPTDGYERKVAAGQTNDYGLSNTPSTKKAKAPEKK